MNAGPRPVAGVRPSELSDCRLSRILLRAARIDRQSGAAGQTRDALGAPTPGLAPSVAELKALTGPGPVLRANDRRLRGEASHR